MPNIVIDEATMNRVKSKTGLYAERKKKYSSGNTIRIIDVIVPVIESAFREYCKAHTGCTLEMENKEWKRFLGKLQKHL